MSKIDWSNKEEVKKYVKQQKREWYEAKAEKQKSERFKNTVMIHGEEFVKFGELIVFKDGTILNKFFKKIGILQKSGYVYISINYKQCLAHRIIWEAFNGKIPDGMQIDHFNTIRNDNRLDNLRLVSNKENANNPLTKKHMSEGNKGKSYHLRKKVIYYNIKGEYVGKSDSITSAAKLFGCSNSTIADHCNNKKAFNGYFFSFNNL